MANTHPQSVIDSPWMSNEDLASYAHVSIATVRSWRYRGVGPVGHRVGRHVRYHRDDVDQWIRSGGAAEPSGRVAS